MIRYFTASKRDPPRRYKDRETLHEHRRTRAALQHDTDARQGALHLRDPSTTRIAPCRRELLIAFPAECIEIP
jgi:hypothetical protein